MMNNYNNCLPMIAAVLAVLIFGCLNLECFKVKQKGSSDPKTKFEDTNGVPNYLWLALIGLVAGVLVCMLQQK